MAVTIDLGKQYETESEEMSTFTKTVLDTGEFVGVTCAVNADMSMYKVSFQYYITQEQLNDAGISFKQDSPV